MVYHARVYLVLHRVQHLAHLRPGMKTSSRSSRGGRIRLPPRPPGGRWSTAPSPCRAPRPSGRGFPRRPHRPAPGAAGSCAGGRPGPEARDRPRVPGPGLAAPAPARSRPGEPGRVVHELVHQELALEPLDLGQVSQQQHPGRLGTDPRGLVAVVQFQVHGVHPAFSPAAFTSGRSEEIIRPLLPMIRPRSLGSA